MNSGWIYTLTRNTGVKCAICGENDPRVVKEEHHIFGRANSSETIWLCHNCHDKITHNQNLLAPKARSGKAGKEGNTALELVSMGSLIELVGQQLIKEGMVYGGSG